MQYRSSPSSCSTRHLPSQRLPPFLIFFYESLSLKERVLSDHALACSTIFKPRVSIGIRGAGIETARRPPRLSAAFVVAND